MNREKTNTLIIRTPDGIVFPLLIAGPVTRFLAWGTDFACIAAAISVVSGLLGAFGLISLDLVRGLSIIAYFLISIGYSIASEWLWNGQTVGKKLLGLRVMDVQGLRLQFSQIMIRNLLRFADSLPLFYFLGGAACFLSRRCQRLGDIAANTIVVRMHKASDPDLDNLIPDMYNSLRNYPHLAARLRQQVTPREADIAVQALLRRNELVPGARIELFAQIASYLRSVVGFPEEVTDGVTDEQYVRNVVDIIFRSKPASGGSK